MTDPEQPGDNSHPAVRYLILMRHAKSDWSDDSLSDHDRPLNARGQRDAPRMAQWLESVDLIPDVILSSSSERTRETVGLMTEQWPQQPQITFDESLYLATPETILAAPQSETTGATRLMLVAHNPGMAHLASVLSGKFTDMPTAAIAVFEVETSDWSQFGQDTPMRLVHFMRPKAL